MPRGRKQAKNIRYKYCDIFVSNIFFMVHGHVGYSIGPCTTFKHFSILYFTWEITIVVSGEIKKKEIFDEQYSNRNEEQEERSTDR